MKFLFLDIDGVLNTTTSTELNTRVIRELRSKPIKTVFEEVDLILATLDYECIKSLKRIVDNTRCMVVITSTYKYDKNIYKYIVYYLEHNGIRIYGSTPDCNYNRELEIKNYLDIHKYDNYVIVDDDLFLEDDDMDNHLFTSYYDLGGIVDVEKDIINYLGRVSDIDEEKEENRTR